MASYDFFDVVPQYKVGLHSYDLVHREKPFSDECILVANMRKNGVEIIVTNRLCKKNI